MNELQSLEATSRNSSSWTKIVPSTLLQRVAWLGGGDGGEEEGTGRASGGASGTQQLCQGALGFIEEASDAFSFVSFSNGIVRFLKPSVRAGLV